MTVVDCSGIKDQLIIQNVLQSKVEVHVFCNFPVSNAQSIRKSRSCLVFQL